jgi:hypothetical protein
VFFNPETLIIETYQELMGVLLGMAIAAVGLRLAWVKYRTGETQPKARPAPSPVPLAPLPTIRLRDAEIREFDRLATMISTVSQRAERVSATQSQAALKLDTVEMAMHRLLTDVDGLVALPKHAAPPSMATTASAAVSARATLAA